MYGETTVGYILSEGLLFFAAQIKTMRNFKNISLFLFLQISLSAVKAALEKRTDVMKTDETALTLLTFWLLMRQKGQRLQKHWLCLC